MRWREERAHGLEQRRGGRATRWRPPARAVVFSGTTVGDRPARARRPAGAVPAQHRLRRDADPAGQRGRRGHAAAGRSWRPIGPQLDWPHAPARGQGEPGWTPGRVRRAPPLDRGDGGAARSWLRSSSRRRRIQLGNARRTRSPSRGDARQGLVALERSGIGPGALTPFDALVPDGSRAADAAKRLAQVDGVRGAVAPAAWRRAGHGARRPSSRTPTATLAGAGRDTLGSSPARARRSARRRAAAARAQSADFLEAVYGNFPLMIALDRRC